MKVSLTGEAELELMEGAQHYFREADAQLGNAFISEFERCVELLRKYPEFGAKWRGSTRRLPLRRFPFNLIYMVQSSELRIIAVAHQSRRPSYWRGRA